MQKNTVDLSMDRSGETHLWIMERLCIWVIADNVVVAGDGNIIKVIIFAPIAPVLRPAIGSVKVLRCHTRLFIRLNIRLG